MGRNEEFSAGHGGTPEFDGKALDEKIRDATNGLLETAYSDDRLSHHVKPVENAMNRLFENSTAIENITSAGHPLDAARGVLPSMMRDAKSIKKRADSIGDSWHQDSAQALIDHLRSI